jgi:hypothetical protein
MNCVVHTNELRTLFNSSFIDLIHIFAVVESKARPVVEFYALFYTFPVFFPLLAIDA